YTNRYYVLMATESAPTMLISGIPMHRIKDTNPHADTLAKLRAVKPVFGQVLDTATGLGYTAIEAARSASHVVTIELDPTVLEIIRQNPWSQDLLDNPRITQLIGDSFDRIEEFADGSFDRIIHDPPTISLAGELYSTDFYRQLYRVLRGSGILFHYIGNLDSKLGKNVSRGVAKRLQAAGFRRIHDRKDAYGLAARK
ncbi:MAG: RsmD family RNA methyltransferase, partial [Anaerolineales bacterium]